MIEVDSLRRPFHIGHFDQPALGPQPLPAPITAPLEKTRVLVHWNQEPDKAAKSDGEDDDDDEYRPFTPPPPRERLSYTRYQLELLNGIYQEVRYPNSTQKQLIAKRVGITREQVKIWFQNRRRKDVVGTGKTKQGDDSISSVNSNSSSSSKDSEKADDNESLSEGSASDKESEESVVPNVVLKSIIGELKRFLNDPLKGKKNRKKAKTKQKEKASLKKGLATTLMTGGYDMISPPNQVTPSAFFEKMKNGFNHSKGSSAFETPRGDAPRPLQINGVSSSSDNRSPPVSGSHDNTKTSSGNTSNYGNYIPSGFMPNGFSNMHLQSHPPNNLPVLSDLFSYKPHLDTRPKDMRSPASAQQTPYTPPANGKSETNRNINPGGFGIGPPPPGRYFGGIFPYPFLAEQPVLLSSVRQPDQIFRPSPHYAFPKFSEDPYQPLMISSLSNPYYSPPSSSSWTNTLPNPTTYTSL